MGWVMLVLIGVAAALALWLGRVSWSLWSFVGAALMLGVAGYTIQEPTSQPGHPVESFTQPITIDPQITDLRDSMLGRFTADNAYLIAADAMMRSGDTRSAVQVVLGGIAKYPQSTTLWTGLGSAYAQHDGTVSPAALFAFRRAAHLSPLHPAPPFFLGLAYIQTGQFALARPYWARAVALTPPGLSYHAEIAGMLKKLDDYLAAADRAQAQAAGAP
jgi:cytochrome c-type biogenesis protein CcmH/NrfG